MMVAMSTANHDDPAVDTSSSGNPGWLAAVGN
jgi:hypothetical protein